MGVEMRVFGPPGTGKTTYLSNQIAQAAERYSPESLLVASFTRTAAHEIASRIDDLNLEHNQVGTLHALCYRALGSPTIAETKIKEFNDFQNVYRLSGDGVDLDEPEQVFETDGDKLFADYQVCRARIQARATWPMDVAAFAALWEQWKRDNSYIDFTDMIETALDYSTPPPGQATVGFFDEVQDFTPLELALVRMWASYLDYTVMAGDDDQAIYGFKGANPHAFLHPPVADEYKRVLSQSYRMPMLVHMYSQQWIASVGEREPKFFRARDEMGSVEIRPELRYIDPERLVEEAASWADSERKTVMLLASCSYQVQPIVQELRNQGWPFHNPYRRKRGDWNPIRGQKGQTTTAQRILALLRPDTSPHAAWGLESRPWTLGDARQFMALLPRTGVVKRGAFKEVEEGPADQMLDAEMCERVFEPGVVDALLTKPLDFLSDHASKEVAKKIEYPINIIKKRGPWYLSVPPRIVVGTIHSVKGGEADGVYVLPDLSRAGAVEAADPRTADNVRRQMYVAMTRAAQRLVLCGPSGSTTVSWPML